MLRLHLKSFGRILTTNGRIVQNRRQFSSRSSSKLKVTVALSSGAIAFTAFTVAYAKYDKEFAEQLTKFAPFLKRVLEEVPDLNADFGFPSIQKSVSMPKSSANKLENNPLTPLKNDSKPQKTANTPNSEKTNDESPNVPGKESGNQSRDSILKTDEESLKTELTKVLQQKNDKQDSKEDEFRAQLKRLLYAFNDFYEEKRILYETEIKRMQEVEMKNTIVEERQAIAGEYEKAMKKLKQMEKLLDIREKLDKQETAGKKLWLLSQSLAKILEHDRSLPHEIAPIEIQEKIETIRNVIQNNFSDETLIQVALNSLSEDAIQNGVYSEEDLIKRFQNLQKTANRVALVPDEYTDLFGYLKSYTYSLIRPLLQIEVEMSTNPIRTKQIPPEELEGKLDVDPDEWDTYDILQRVDLCVQNRNFEMALRYANLLKGEPKNVARDWIKDTREHLEVKQALDLVQNKIAAISLHQLSFSA